MLINHTLDHETHIYHVAGEFTLSTSDVIWLNGLSDMGMIPSGNLVHAGHRGSATSSWDAGRHDFYLNRSGYTGLRRAQWVQGLRRGHESTGGLVPLPGNCIP